MISYFIILVYYLIIDLTMIYVYNGRAFGEMIKKIQGKPMKIRLLPSVLAFLVIAFGLDYFVLERIRDDNIVWDSFRYGFIWGLVVYGVYDLTNLGTISGYTFKVGLVDWLWGGLISFVVILLTKLTMRKLGR